MDDIKQLEHIAKEIRKKIFYMIYKAGGGHIAPAFSIVELVTALYFRILRLNKDSVTDESRDRFILSKGHACAALYAVLVQAGFAPQKVLEKFCQPDGIIGGHPDIAALPGIEATTGSLGHGFPFSMGLALSAKLDGKDYRVFTILGDGECQEGSIWEAALFASHHNLDNLIGIIDYNKYQALEPIKDVLALEPLKAKWESFNWAVKEVDGHNLQEIINVLSDVPFERDKPNFVIAHTIKGKGVSFMENVPIWHYRLPNEEETKIAVKELGMEGEL